MKTKCDHIIGEWQGADEGGVVRVSSWDTDTDLEERYKFCPLCGKNTSKLRPLKAKEVKRTPEEQRFVDGCTSMFVEQMNKHLERPSLTNVLRNLGTGKTVGTKTFERAISTDPE